VQLRDFDGPIAHDRRLHRGSQIEIGFRRRVDQGHAAEAFLRGGRREFCCGL